MNTVPIPYQRGRHSIFNVNNSACDETQGSIDGLTITEPCHQSPEQQGEVYSTEYNIIL